MIENIKRKFPPKTGMREKQLLQDPGYVDTVDTCCMLHAMRQGAILIVFTMYETRSHPNSFHYVC